MIKFNNTAVYGIGAAIRGMRNPYKSWKESDSEGDKIGKYDMELAKSLIKGGPSHRKFLRQIAVSTDITAPFYWWKEADTYKVGTVADSESTMHTLHLRDLTMDDFSTDGCDEMAVDALAGIVKVINRFGASYAVYGDAQYWRSMVQLLPSSFNQMRTWTANYEVLLNIYQQRKGHKLSEWAAFREWIEGLPYMEEFLVAAGLKAEEEDE